MNLFYGVLWGVVGQILTFLQLQGNVKWNWMQRYPISTLLMSIPMAYCYIKSVEYLVKAYNGELWPSRMIGFGVGIIIFYVMSIILFGETISTKTFVCLLLAIAIILVQIFWK
jgi:hypothetical protein